MRDRQGGLHRAPILAERPMFVPVSVLNYPAKAVIVLCGLPGIGKTTFIERVSHSAVHLDLDRFFDEFGVGGFAVGQLFEEAEHRLEAGQPVIIDTTGLREEIREECKRLAGRYGMSCHLLVFDGDGEIAALRRSQRQREPLRADAARGYEQLWRELSEQLGSGAKLGFDSIIRLDPVNQNGIRELRFGPDQD